MLSRRELSVTCAGCCVGTCRMLSSRELSVTGAECCDRTCRMLNILELSVSGAGCCTASGNYILLIMILLNTFMLILND